MESTEDSVKGTWNAKAKGSLSGLSGVSSAVKGAKKALTGYQYYVKEQMPVVNVMADVPSTGRMAKIGALWKALTKDAQKAYSDKAKLFV